MFRRRTPSRVEQFIDQLRRESGDRFAWRQTLPPEPPRFAEPEAPLPRSLARALADLGIDRLYAHQATVIDRVRRGEHVVLATPTASGKTLAFNLPIAERLLAHPAARALYVYPTNALVNDQHRALTALLALVDPALDAAVFTGATDQADRRLLRARPPRVLLTNPEMLHLSLTGRHDLWTRLLRDLQFVVLDELHMYRGLFGAHMALAVRRLLRAAALHGAQPQLIGCSATIGNPGELAERLTDLPFSVVEAGGAARGSRTLVVWRSPASGHVDAAPDPAGEAVRLFCRTVSEGLGTILFALTRRGAEAMLMQARERLGPSLAARVAPYRNGYTPEQRRRVEEELKSGRLLGVVSTNALEVGVDVGGLDVAIIAGFPGSRTSFWQQAGRAGRGPRGALILFVPYERVVDGYYAAHPDELLAGRFENAVIDLTNPHVLSAHLACAAAERELRPADLPRLSPVAAQVIRMAERSGVVRRSGRGWTATDDGVHARVSLRGAGSDTWQILGPAGDLGTIDAAHLHREAFPGAIYLHEGARYRVMAHDPAVRTVRVAAERALLVTDPVLQTVVTVESTESERALSTGRSPLRLGFGAVRLEQTTTGYRELHPRGRRHERSVMLSPPLTHRLSTAGCWVVFPDEIRRRVDALEGPGFASGLHALEHVLPSALSLHLLCDPHDVLATYELAHQGLRGPTLFLVDARDGGAGIAARAAAAFPELLRISATIVGDCRCKDGCPSCIVTTTCWRQFDPADKAAALQLLAELTGRQ